MRQGLVNTMLGLLLVVGPATPARAAHAPGVVDLRCEYKKNPIGIDVARPRLSWKLSSAQRGTMQSAYEIRVARDRDDLLRGAKLLWTTGRVKSDRSVHVPYSGPPLASGQRAYWRVRIWDEKGRSSAWSAPAFWEMGLLDPTDWSGSWISPDLVEDAAISNPCPLLRHEFDVEGDIVSARAYVTALGLYSAELNGQSVGDQLFTPGWTSYDHRIQYQTYDITTLLRSGRNAVGVTLGDGWYRGFLGWKNKNRTYGDKLALLLEIRIRYRDGREQAYGTDTSWKCATGPIRMSAIYHGEIYDARLEIPGWSRPGFDDSEWSGVVVLERSKSTLVAPVGPPMRRIQELKPARILATPAGETVFDLGQNMVGRVRLKVRGKAGTVVTLRHAEVLDRAGNLYVENLRGARQTVEYTLKGGDVESYEPHFTFQGFRYVAVDGYPGQPDLDAITGIVIHSDIESTGAFSCSEPLLNRLQSNIWWGQKGNFLDVPTDCPQRDERMGWTGDAQAFAPTACFNAGVAGFFTKWLRDLAADQQPSGAVPHVIPNVLSHNEPSGQSASAGWADAAVVVPWTVYLAYGDARILEEQYDSMRAWVDYMKTRAGETYLWKSDFTYGDWLAFATTRSDYPGATTDKDLITTAYFAHSTDLFRRTAAVLGRTNDVAEYSELFEKIRAAFVREFVTPAGRLASNTQTAYSLALAFDLMPEALRDEAARRLAEDVRRFSHITTGFLGTPLVCHVLADYGYWDEAFLLLNRKDYPSWLYPITRGATTIWERWDGIKADGTFQSPGMNSFNHYAYGAIGHWLYSRVAGIQIDDKAPGYKHVLIRPHPGGGLTSFSASHMSLYGRVSSSWESVMGENRLEIEIPPNTSATVQIPAPALETLLETGRPLARATGIRKASMGANAVIVELGSGKYSFQWPTR